MSSPGRRKRQGGFSLLEILVSNAVLGGVFIVIATTISTMQNTWQKVRGRSDIYRNARAAAETVTRRLGLATLGSRWEMSDERPPKLELRSDLHFLCGPVKGLDLPVSNALGHAVFFQAPMGVDDVDKDTPDTQKHENLSGLLNAWGYFVQYGPPPLPVPRFMTKAKTEPQKRNRFRLMEFRQPTAELGLFKTDGTPAATPKLAKASSEKSSREWLSSALRGSQSKESLSVLADNVVALIIRPIAGGHPDLSEQIAKQEIAPNMEYDSRLLQTGDSSPLAYRTHSQLPPALAITLVVVSEDSWTRLDSQAVEVAARQIIGVVNNGFGDAGRYETDLRRLVTELDKQKMEHQVINLVVPIAEGRKDAAE